MTLTEDNLKQRWTPISAEADELKDVKEYVPLRTIESKAFERQLLCKGCEEVVFFVEDKEIWNTKESGRDGKMMLPAGVSATIYRGKYLIV